MYPCNTHLHTLKFLFLSIFYNFICSFRIGPWTVFFEEYEMPPFSAILATLLTVISIVLWLNPLPYTLFFNTDRKYFLFVYFWTYILKLSTRPTEFKFHLKGMDLIMSVYSYPCSSKTYII